MCLAQGPQCSDAGEAQTRVPRSRVKHSTTEPLRSLIRMCSYEKAHIHLKFMLNNTTIFLFITCCLPGYELLCEYVYVLRIVTSISKNNSAMKLKVDYPLKVCNCLSCCWSVPDFDDKLNGCVPTTNSRMTI